MMPKKVQYDPVFQASIHINSDMQWAPDSKAAVGCSCLDAVRLDG